MDGMMNRALAEITPDPKNANTHTVDHIRQIAASITTFGFNDPVVVDQNGVIVEGHGRFLAAQHLGLEEVPVLVQSFKTEKERLAYAIAHNRTQQLTGLDEGMVLNEFDRIGLEREEQAAVGFTEDEIIFMQLRADATEAASGGGGGGGGGTAPAQFAANKSITTKVEFDTQDQLFGWLNGMDWLRTTYPEAMTISDRMVRLMDDYEGAL